jgi:hypothetical protein
VVVDWQGKCGALHDGGGIGGPDPSLRRCLSHRILRSTRLPLLRYSQIAERTNKPPFSGQLWRQTPSFATTQEPPISWTAVAQHS